MTEERYNEILASAEFRFHLSHKLIHIKEYLRDNRASVMVGSGFSKNAEKDKNVIVKDWNELAKDFYHKLYSCDPKDGDLELKSALRLASQVVCQFGKSCVEDIIRAAVPNDKIKPGPLHFQLVNLNWTDIFTTNYDTLLESANIRNRYTHVTNKSTLLYAPQPRIIKLHGSFPDTTPFIIDEEDYRTYPEKYPEFVNTVRQSLIERILCLVGFSGDDPNFLSWIGWIRDVMGNRLAPIYMFEVSETDLHPSEVNLLKKRGVEVIQMTPIFKGNIKEFFEFVFKFLDEDESDKQVWNGAAASISGRVEEFRITNNVFHRELNAEKIKTLVDAYRNMRESYPGWIFMPTYILTSSFENSVFSELEDIRSFINAIPDEIIVDFLYEVDWRVRMAFIPPTTIQWLITRIEKLIDSLSAEEILSDYRLVSLSNTLLSHYRLIALRDKFEILRNKISGIINSSDTENIRRYYYEYCLNTVSILEYQETRKIIDAWKPAAADYLGILWKSAILTEIGEDIEAHSLLTKAKQLLENTDTTSMKQDVVKSIRGALISNISVYEQFMPSRYTANIDITPYQISEYFKHVRSQLREAVSKKEAQAVEREHGFNLEQVTTHYTMGRPSNDKEIRYAGRLHMIREMFGYPFRLKHCSIDPSTIRLSCESLFREGSFAIALNSLIRACQADTNRAILSKSRIMMIPKNWAKEWVDLFIAKAELIKDWDNNDMMTMRLGIIVLLILPKFSVILDAERNISIARIIVKLYSTNNRDYKNEYLRTVYNCLSMGEKYKLIPDLAECPLRGKQRQNDILFPHVDVLPLKISDKAIDIIIQGLMSDSEEIRNAAYRRSTKIYSFCSVEQKESLSCAIRTWRSLDMLHDKDAVYSFNMVDYDPSEKYSPEQRVEFALEKLSQSYTNVDIAQIDNPKKYPVECSESLSILNAMAAKMKKDQVCRMLPHIVRILRVVLETFRQESDEMSKFFGRSEEADFDAINYILNHINIQYIDSSNKTILLEIYNDFAYIGYPKYFVIERLGRGSKFIENSYTEEKIFSADESDRKQALEYRFSKEIKPASNLWKDTLNKLRFSNSTDVPDFLSAIVDGLDNIQTSKISAYRFNLILSEMIKKVQDNAIPSDYRYDIAYNTKRMAGYLSCYEEGTLKESLEPWLPGAKMDEILPNDVKLGFEEGVALWKKHQNELNK